MSRRRRCVKLSQQSNRRRLLLVVSCCEWTIDVACRGQLTSFNHGCNCSHYWAVHLPTLLRVCSQWRCSAEGRREGTLSDTHICGFPISVIYPAPSVAPRWCPLVPQLVQASSADDEAHTAELVKTPARMTGTCDGVEKERRDIESYITLAPPCTRLHPPHLWSLKTASSGAKIPRFRLLTVFEKPKFRFWIP